MKVKRQRSCVILLFFGGFALCWVLFYMFFVKNIKFFITKILVIIYKLNTIKKKFHKEKDFAMVLAFFSFCLSPRKIAKEEEEIEIKKCVVGVNM